LVVFVGASFDISIACSWWGIIICKNMMSEADSKASLPIVPLLIIPEALEEGSGAALLLIVQADNEIAAAMATTMTLKDFLFLI
jgi:hypothetical protein